MAVTTFTEENTSPLPPKRIFKASVVDSHNLIPKLMPQAIKSIEVQGDGGVGSIKTINFPDGFAGVSVVDALGVQMNLNYVEAIMNASGVKGFAYCGELGHRIRDCPKLEHQ